MGLTSSSSSRGAMGGFTLKKKSESDKVIAIAGNPNVGKSTLFNALTGLNQHTGNWTGKTVESAQGYFSGKRHDYCLVDIPGTYSLFAHSAEEEIARNFICFGDIDAAVVVCDATCLERNLNLVLQVMEVCPRVLVCVNLIDEAKRKKIHIDIKGLEKALGVRVVPTVARKKKTLNDFIRALDDAIDSGISHNFKLIYPQRIEDAIASLKPLLEKKTGGKINARWLALRLIDRDVSLCAEIEKSLGIDLLSDSEVLSSLGAVWQKLGYKSKTSIKDEIVSSIVKKAEEIAEKCVKKSEGKEGFDQKIDKIVTHRFFAFPIMLCLLLFVFWLTISLANYPSALLSSGFSFLEGKLTSLFELWGAPDWLYGALILGVYRTLSWVVSVMLPPMAIFFPLFTLLEDLGFLPRIAYNLDRPFHACGACGKQALTMCMGFGCNAAGVVGCRIIDSPRERLLSILTNNFVPCNGRFPILISVISMFFVSGLGAFGSILSSALLTCVIILGVAATFFSTHLLSKTLLKGEPSAFVLELPPYRKPQIAKTLVRSVLDRTLFVLGRAVISAAPAGFIIWAMANITVSDASLLSHCAAFLDPFGSLLGVDGVIILAFILGLPANEIVIPIIIMAYLSQGALTETPSLLEMRELFVANGWTYLTAINVMLLTLFHFPCSTTLLTIKKETGSLWYTLLAAALPTAIGIILCMLTTFVAKIIA